MENKFRLEWVDYAKAIAIILVVYRHILIGVQRSGITVDLWLININEVVYSFRMPLFFLLSGIFVAKSIAKRQGYRFVGYKFNTIYYPYLIWGVIQITLQIILSKYTNANRSIIDYTYLLINPRAIDQLWYLSALFTVSILFYLLYSYFNFKNIYIFFLSVILYGFSAFVKDYSLIHDLCYYIIFFVIGHLISNILLEPKNFQFLYSLKLFLLLTPLFWYSQWYWLHNQDMNMYLFAIIALLGTAYVFSISFILAKYKLFSFMKIVGKHSLQIYLLHVMIIAAVRIVLTNILGLTQPEVILLIGWILGVYLPILMYNIIKTTKLIVLFKPSFGT